MRLRYLATALLLLATTVWPAYATHNGPIVLGETRREQVTICSNEDDALYIAELEAWWIQRGESVETLIDFVEDIQFQEDCSSVNIVYRPLEVLSEWVGWVSAEKTGLAHLFRVEVLMADLSTGEGFVFSTDPLATP